MKWSFSKTLFCLQSRSYVPLSMERVSINFKFKGISNIQVHWRVGIRFTECVWLTSNASKESLIRPTFNRSYSPSFTKLQDNFTNPLSLSDEKGNQPKPYLNYSTCALVRQIHNNSSNNITFEQHCSHRKHWVHLSYLDINTEFSSYIPKKVTQRSVYVYFELPSLKLWRSYGIYARFFTWN